MKRIAFNNTPLSGLHVIERQALGDERGFLERIFCQQTFKPFIEQRNIRQINHTLTQKKGTVRGLHFQYSPYAETKIVSCIKGKVWDVAVDLRKGSPTFLQHHFTILSEDNFQSFLIPEGFAHGFQTLTVNCEMLYFHTADYNKEAEGALNALEPRVKIEWPLPISDRSSRDINHSMLSNDFNGIDFL